jgi:hypothetical protein
VKPATFQQMITKDLIGKTTAVKGCLTCFPQQRAYTYGLGIVSTGNWPVQDPLSPASPVQSPTCRHNKLRLP